MAITSIQDFRPEYAGTPEEEKELALMAAVDAIKKFRSEKFNRAYGAKIMAARIPKVITASAMYDEVIEKRAKEIYGQTGIELDQYNKDIIKMLCYYFTNDKEFEQYKDHWDKNYSLNKGLYVHGPVGCGKTTLLEMFAKNQKQSFAVRSCLRIADDYQNKGMESVGKYFNLIPAHDNYEYFGQKYLGINFDDLGTEVKKKHFGNEANIMRDIILARYEKGFTPGTTHITSNITPAEAKERYGLDEQDKQRFSSRMRAMFNVITFDKNSPDRRK